MSDSLVCPVCRSRPAPGAPVCVTCGAPLLLDPRLRGEGGPRQGGAEVTGLPPGFPLWPVGERDGDSHPALTSMPAQQPPMQPGLLSPQPPAPWPFEAPAAPVGGPAADWTDASGAAGPWGPAPGMPPPAWPQQGAPAGWGQAGPSAASPPSFRDEGAASQVGWLPVNAEPRSSRGGVKPGDCWNCGQSNARNRAYCKRCGQRLSSDLVVRSGGAHPLTPVAGGRGRRAIAFVWTVLVLAVVVVVGVVAFGGFIPRGTDERPSPRTAASIAPATSPGTAGASAVPRTPAASPAASSPPLASLAGSPAVSARPTVTPTSAPTPSPRSSTTSSPSAAPTATPTPTPTTVPTPTPPMPTPTPTAVPTPTPTALPLSSATPGPIRTTASPRAPAPESFECDGTRAIRDPRDRGWRLSGIYWAERTVYDRITLRLVPEVALDGAVARVSVETVPVADLAEMELPEPAEGRLAIIVRFSNAVTLTRAIQGAPEKTAVRSLTALTAEDGRVHTILGVLGQGCFSVQAPMWTDPSKQDTPFVDVTVDVRH